MLLLDEVDLLERLDPNGLAVGAVRGVVFENLRNGGSAAADDLLEERVVDQISCGLEAVDGAAEDLVAVEAEFLNVGGECLDCCGAGFEDGFLLG